MNSHHGNGKEYLLPEHCVVGLVYLPSGPKITVSNVNHQVSCKGFVILAEKFVAKLQWKTSHDQERD